MRKFYALITLLIGFWGFSSAQTYPLLTIQQIQQPASIGSCDDSSTYFRDTVRIRGVVVCDGGLAQAASGRNIWIQQNGGGAWNGIDLFGYNTATSPDDVLDLVAGDSVEVLGFIDEFSGESEIRPLQAGTSVTLLGSGRPVFSTVVNIADLNDAARNNQIATGEQWEGGFIELQNVTVSSVDYFSGGNRVSFNVQDGSGNTINVSDRFIVQRLPANGGNFDQRVPSVGDVYCSLKGVLVHSKNDCAGFSGRGYELYPFDTTHYVICSAAPNISGITRNAVCATPSNPVSICASIADADGVASATLRYAVGLSNNTYQSVTMTNTSGSTYCADIPAQADGSFIKFYISATDNASNTSIVPNVPGGVDPKWYWSRNNGCTIYDLQFVPSTFASDQSGYLGNDVTVEGVVTASSSDLGYVFIQQENQIGWAGIMLVNNASLSQLSLGQKVQVSGSVEENFGFTRLNVTNVTPNGTGTISPVSLDPSVFTTYDLATNEIYESMLVELKNSTPSTPIYVVDQNPDAPSNFAEWRVGSDQFDPSSGSRIISGRQTGSAFSSLNVSAVNDSMWEVTDGLMNVPVCVMHVGDQFDAIRGIMFYSFSNMKLAPRNNNDFTNGPACIITALDNEVNGDKIVAYPNPTMGRLTVEYSLHGNATVALMDLMGRNVASANLNGLNGSESLDLSNLPAGTYVMVVTGSNGERLHTDRIVVAK